METSPLTGIRRILLTLGTVALAGIALAVWLGGTFAGRPDPRSTYSAFFVLFARNEVLGLALVVIFSFAAFFSIAKWTCLPAWPALQVIRQPTALAAVGVFAITALGTHYVCHDYALSADEYMADFQAQIFLRGGVTAEVPEKWRDAVRVIKPTFADYLPATHSWKATYLPVYAAMRAVFQAAYLQALLNPLLAAATVLALYGTARNIWPNERRNAVVAALLLSATPQFLLMSMTGYSMPAHLALNTIWLWLYSNPERPRFYLAPFVGVLAIGLHQPIVHALFAAPFLVRLVLQRKWRAGIAYGIVYALGCAGWYAWRAHYLPPTAATAPSMLRLFNAKMLVVQPMDLLLVIGWSCLATPLLAIAGFGRIFRARPILQDAALSCLLTFGFYYFFYLDQGHGWGYRYFHGALGCFVLVAVAGWEELARRIGHVRLTNFAAIGITASLLIQLPIRCYQAESFIRPFAAASDMMHASNTALVGIDPHDAWYAADLIRNDPFLENRPVVVALFGPEWRPAYRLRPAEVAALSRAGSARFISKQELHDCGLGTVAFHDFRPEPFRLGMGDR